MKVLKQFVRNVGRKKAFRQKYHYEFVKEYPNIYLYRCKENGCLESFPKKQFLIKNGEVFFNDYNYNETN